MRPSSCRKTSSGLPLILHYGELYNYFIIYCNVIIIEIKCTINVMYLNHPETIPCPWSLEKLSSMKLIPGAKKVEDHCSVLLFSFGKRRNRGAENKSYYRELTRKVKVEIRLLEK